MELYAESSNQNSNINWYDSPLNGNLIYSGNTFTTDFLDATTSYYANYSEVIGSENIGSIAHEGSNEYSGSANSSGGLIFDVYKSLILESVDVFTNQAGNRKIILMDSENGLAMNLGETYLVTKNGNIRLGNQKMDLVII